MTTLTLKKPGLLVFCLVLFSMFGKAQLTANFTADPQTGCAPLVVHFSDASTGNPTHWRWDLGNGTISFLQNPSVTYFLPGHYDIKLVVTNAQGADSVVRTGFIEIYDQPVISFNATPTSGCYPLNVQFTDLTDPVSGTAATWQWDFGDGTFGDSQHPNHTYTAAGNFNVSLVVTNSHGCSKNLTRAQYIQVAHGVTANFTNSSQSGCAAPASINFQNSSQGVGTITYLWNFGDGNSSSEENPSHVYNSVGSYEVTLIATNQNGCSDTIVRSNAVTIGEIHSGFTAPDTVCKGVPVNFVNISTPAPGTAFWDFGDGTNSTEISPEKNYQLAGTYTIKLINNYGACTDSVFHTIVINPRPNVNFISADTASCSVPFTVQFTNTSTGADTYQWIFGDGTTSTLPNPTHTYTSYGNYTVRLIAFPASGCSNSVIKTDFIKIQPPAANILHMPQEGCAPFEWTFSSNVNSPDSVTSYFWDFGDGSTSTQTNPTHIFNEGTYNIKLIIFTSNGCSDTVTVNNAIKAGIRPHSAFYANPLDACARVPVNFFDTTATTIDRWLWDFGDGSNSTLQNPIHTYTDTGFYHVSLIVWNNGCPDTLVKENYVHINPPIASFDIAADCRTPMVRTFTDHSIGADTWHWDFGDGTTSTEINPIHIYATGGTYTVTLTVTNLQSGCDFENTQTVRIISETADFIASQTTVCRNMTVNFEALGSNPANIAAYKWLFGDNTAGTGHNISHSYAQSGLYNISLEIIDRNGCRDTMVKPQYIRVNGPTAGFTVSPTTTCLLSDVAFTDTSHSDGINQIISWTWNYGDGVIQTLNAGPFTHTYSSGGSYNITLTVTDAVGCSDTSRMNSALTVSHPVAAFTSADTLSCPGKNIQFANASTGNTLSYEWSFGDGSTMGTSAAPVHVYNNDGLFDIKLVVRDFYGCMDSLTRPAYIHIASPVANFTASDTLGTCPPLIVNFSNTSSNFVTYSWDFGDGTTSNQPNPSHFYNIPGEYFAKLSVRGPGGCISVKTQKIVVRGPYGQFNYTPLTGCAPMDVRFTGTTHDQITFIWDFNDGETFVTTDSIVSHTYTVPGVYRPKMLLQDAAGCTVAIFGNDTISVYGVTAGMEFNPPVVCDQGNVVFTNTSISNDPITGYEWNFGDGATSGSMNTSHFYSTHGAYYPSLIVSTAHGCMDTAHAETAIRIVSTPQGVITQTSNGCVPVTLNFNGSLAAADTLAMNWQWHFGNGDTSTLQHPASVVYNTAGTYQVSLVVTNSLGCSDTTQTEIEAYPIPAVNAGADITSCHGTGKQLNATGADTYSWSPATGLSCSSCANPVANPNTEQDYIVKGTTIHGCSANDSVHVSVAFPIHVTGSPADSVCMGSSAELSVSGAATYQWFPSHGLSSTTGNHVTARPDHTLTYEVIGSDAVGCFKDTVHIPLRVFPIPTVEAGPDATINVGYSIDLIPQISSDVTSATWSPTSGQFRSDWPSVTVKPKETTTYTIDVANAGGCTARDSRTVYVICNGANVFIPNTFSPNGDGVNDVFFIRGTGLFTIRSVRIFNRWGEMVYQRGEIRANDANAGWDGTYKGQKLNPDVYVYVVDITCDNNTILTYKGNIALIK